MESTRAGALAPHQSAVTREDVIMRRVFLNPAVILLLVMTLFPLLWPWALVSPIFNAADRRPNVKPPPSTARKTPKDMVF